MFTRLNTLTATPRRRRLAAGMGFILAALLASVSIFATGPNATPAARTEKAWPVSVIEVTPAAIRPTFTAYGRVESSNVTHLKTDLNAPVAAVHVREGDWAEAGDVLVTLDARELELALAERRAELAQLTANLESVRIEKEMLEAATEQYRSVYQVAEKKLQRHQDLMAKRLISRSLLDEVQAEASQASIRYRDHMRALADAPNRMAAAQATVARARAQVSQAELDIDKTRITAPFRGPILGVFVAPGDRSSLGATLADIANADTFEVRVQVPGRYGDLLQHSLEQGSTVAATSKEGVELTLSRLSGRVRPGQSGLDAFFELEVADGTTHTALGRLIELSVTLPEEQQVVALPVQSLYENDRIYAVETVTDTPVGAASAFRLEAITIERVGEVQSGDGEHRILVRSPDIHVGDRIITTQLPRAISGLLVEPA